MVDTRQAKIKDARLLRLSKESDSVHSQLIGKSTVRVGPNNKPRGRALPDEEDNFSYIFHDGIQIKSRFEEDFDVKIMLYRSIENKKMEA
ncbi:hypothetical protein AAHA92_00186 [Salvia divinorum]|uniref:Uncharacterized protein n=1 Tax=Salvia divinorum TaxID=28513 RepID=A0ABD1IIP7_SALDI